MVQETLEIENMPGLVIVTGMSGAGAPRRCTCSKIWVIFCVDNLPSNLIPNLVELNGLGGGKASIESSPLSAMRETVTTSARLARSSRNSKKLGVEYKMLFLDADDDKLVSRYKSSRRRHPMCTDGTTIAQGIERERRLLMDLHDEADYVINTTDMLPSKLRSTIRSLSGRATSVEALP